MNIDYYEMNKKNVRIFLLERIGPLINGSEK